MTEDHNHTATPIDQPVRCAVYIRVNVSAAHDTESICLQREAARAFLKGRDADGWTCVGTYEDIGHSAGTLERPGFQRLLEDINAGRLDCVIVHALDRLVRMHEDYSMLVALLRRCDVKVIAVFGEPYVVACDLPHVVSKDPSVPYYCHSAQDRQKAYIPIQQDQVRQWAEDHGNEILREFSDDGKPESSGGPQSESSPT